MVSSSSSHQIGVSMLAPISYQFLNIPSEIIFSTKYFEPLLLPEIIYLGKKYVIELLVCKLIIYVSCFLVEY